MLAAADEATGLVGTGFPEDEGHYLHGLVPSAIEHGGPGRFAFDARSHRGPSLTPDADRRVLRDSWEPFWASPSAPIRVEKSPQTLLQTRWIQSIEPTARFVIVLRHPITVALATQKWTRPGPPKMRRLAPAMTLERLVAHWLWAHHLFEQDRVDLDHVEVIRFEDFLHSAAARQGLMDRLGLWSTAPQPEQRRVDRGYHETWKQWLKSPAGRLTARSWLPTAAVAMQRWGYSLDDPLI